MIFGYCRVSTKRQNIQRQIDNIKAAYPTARLYTEKYTGTKTEGRDEFKRLLALVTAGDTIVFDSVSRMSRNAAEGVSQYMELLDRDVELVFLKEPLINTSTYKDALSKGVPLTGSDVDIILNGVNEYLKRLAARQIELAFEQAEKEVKDLRRRTSEGVQFAQRKGKRVGTQKGDKLKVKKKAAAVRYIKKHSAEFGGELTSAACARAAKISRSTYYKYAAELKAERDSSGLQMSFDDVEGDTLVRLPKEKEGE